MALQWLVLGAGVDDEVGCERSYLRGLRLASLGWLAEVLVERSALPSPKLCRWLTTCFCCCRREPITLLASDGCSVSE